MGPVVVVIVGYNDYEANYAGNIEEALAAFRKAGVERVLWATLHESRTDYASMNDMIRDAARRHAEMTVLDWNALSRDKPGWFQPDEIHLTATGAEGMATMVNDALVDLGVAPKPAAPPARRLLAISSRALPAGRRGRAYSALLEATGGTAPYRWARAGGTLPPGLRLAATGRLTGVPQRAGRFTVRARVADRAGGDERAGVLPPGRVASRHLDPNTAAMTPPRRGRSDPGPRARALRDAGGRFDARSLDYR